MLTAQEFLQSQISQLPDTPGVYQMIDQHNNILYIGKAKNLKKRLASYTKHDLSTRIQRMVFQVYQLKYILTNSEAEALLLEATLIKKIKPKFNVLLKDDKSFPYIKITDKDQYPQISKFRGKPGKDASFFGPFASSKQVDVAVTEIQKIFQIRTCSDAYFNIRKRPCLLYQISKCSAPCTGKINQQDYKNLTQQSIAFLSGSSKTLLKTMEQEMNLASADFEYEKAAKLRDRIKAVNYVREKNSMNLTTISNADVIVIVANQNLVCIEVFFYRGGQNFGTSTYFPANSEGIDLLEALSSFLGQFYQNKKPAGKILLNYDLGDQAQVLEIALLQLHDIKTKIVCAKNKEQKTLIEIIEKNAHSSLSSKSRQIGDITQRMLEIGQLFGLSNTPKRIELYDNSHIMGQFAIGAMVVAGPGGFEKNQYRKFNIRTNTNTFGGDDYQMMREMLTRRLAKLSDENRPDLIIIDGGKGHMSTVAEVMQCLGLDIPFVCMSKGPDRNKGHETFYQLGKEGFSLPNDNKTMQYLQYLRDEVHNFAIKSHRAKRGNLGI
jgi:excinuclease ABC subunit C